MQHINATTKAGNRYFYAYNRSKKNSLSQCYGTYSSAKSRAEFLCKMQMQNEGGEGFRILSFNTFGFTCGWITPEGLRVETPQKSLLIS